eukprot:2440610-Pleurochrysis_carterae.AAC.13
MFQCVIHHMFLLDADVQRRCIALHCYAALAVSLPQHLPISLRSLPKGRFAMGTCQSADRRAVTPLYPAEDSTSQQQLQGQGGKSQSGADQKLDIHTKATPTVGSGRNSSSVAPAPPSSEPPNYVDTGEDNTLVPAIVVPELTPNKREEKPAWAKVEPSTPSVKGFSVSDENAESAAESLACHNRVPPPAFSSERDQKKPEVAQVAHTPPATASPATPIKVAAPNPIDKPVLKPIARKSGEDIATAPDGSLSKAIEKPPRAPIEKAAPKPIEAPAQKPITAHAVETPQAKVSAPVAAPEAKTKKSSSSVSEDAQTKGISFVAASAPASDSAKTLEELRETADGLEEEKS